MCFLSVFLVCVFNARVFFARVFFARVFFARVFFVCVQCALRVCFFYHLASYQFNSAGGVLLLASYYCMAATVANSSGESIPLHTSWIRWPLSFCMYVYQTMLCVCLCGMHKRSVLRSLHLKNSELLL